MSKKEVICGIYKITSPTERIYIGQSVDIYYRWSKYKSLTCKDQQGIYNSLKKYTPENHTFEIIEECDFEDLLCRERYWQDYYDVSSSKHLNGKLTKCGDLKQEMSSETKDKISKTLKDLYAKGYKSKGVVTQESREKALLWHLSDLNTIKKQVLNTETGIFYNSLREACNTTNYKYNYFKHMLNPNSTCLNKTSFIVLEK
jgi:group I intron endonuclease